VFQPKKASARFYGDRKLASLLQRTLDGLPEGSVVLEAGCADSTILIYVSSELHFQVAGIDYSPNGCDRFRQRLAEAGVAAHVECCDLFDPPQALLGKFDALLSFGLVEHFTDTERVIRALAGFVRPGGRMLTLVPNMRGAVGWVQRLAGPAIFAVHEALSPSDLATANRTAGLSVIEADYMLPIGFGVVNYHEPASRLVFVLRRVMVGVLARLSHALWAIDERLVRLPKSGWLSPYSYCIAEKASGDSFSAVRYT
jgi:SAM-dependent methyltransferase